MTRTRFEVVSPAHGDAAAARGAGDDHRRRGHGGIVVLARWARCRGRRTSSCGGFCPSLDETALGQAARSLDQLLARQRDQLVVRGQGAGRRQPHPRHRAGAEVRRGDRAGRARGSPQVVGRHAARGAGLERQGQAVAGAGGPQGGEPGRVPGGQGGVRASDVGHVDAARPGPDRRRWRPSARASRRRRCWSRDCRWARASSPPSRTRWACRARCSSASASPPQSARPRSWTKRFGRRGSWPTAPQVNAGDRGYVVRLARAGDGATAARWPGWCRITTTLERARML